MPVDKTHMNKYTAMKTNIDLTRKQETLVKIDSFYYIYALEFNTTKVKCLVKSYSFSYICALMLSSDKGKMSRENVISLICLCRSV